MINVAKGSAHSLYQTDKIATSSATLVAGMVVQFSTDGASVTLPSAHASQANKLMGFVHSNSTDGDVIASGAYGVYLLDGSSVIETDQLTSGQTWDVGKPVYANADGTITATAANAAAIKIGVVDGTRTLPDNEYSTTTVVGVKLSSN